MPSEPKQIHHQPTVLLFKGGGLSGSNSGFLDTVLTGRGAFTGDRATRPEKYIIHKISISDTFTKVGIAMRNFKIKKEKRKRKEMNKKFFSNLSDSTLHRPVHSSSSSFLVSILNSH